MIPAPILLTPSCRARYCLLGLHLTAVGVVALLPRPWSLGALAVIALHLLWALRPRLQVASLQALPEGKVAIFMANGERLEAELLPSSRITAWLMVLHLRHGTGRQDLVLWPDSAPQEVLRQWRVWLRWELPAQRKRQTSVP